MIADDWLFATILLGLFALGAVLVIVIAHADGQPDGVAAGAVALTLVVGLWVLTTWPGWDMDYQTYRPVSGTVTKGCVPDKNCDLRLDGGHEYYQCYVDSRCDDIDTGDHIELSCREYWKFYARNEMRCEFMANNH